MSTKVPRRFRLDARSRDAGRPSTDPIECRQVPRTFIAGHMRGQRTNVILRTFLPDTITLPQDQVSLDAALVPLMEVLAEHVHNRWMQRRTAEGWTFGPNRDDARKTHPGL